MKTRQCLLVNITNTIALALFAMLSFSSATQAQIIVKFKPDSLVGKDAMLQTSYGCRMSSYGANPDTLNFGKSIENLILDWTISDLGCTKTTIRELISFTQLNTIPASATILLANLNLFCVKSSFSWGTSYFTGSPYPLSNPGWVERVTGAWDESKVTWATQPSSTSTNRAAIPSSASRWGWSTSINVTSLVNDIRASGVNYGFLLKLQTEAYYRATLFASSDNADSTLWPELVITYLNDPCLGTTADFDQDSTSCYTFQFTDKSVAKDTGIVAWSWDFGDLTTSTLKNPVKTYLDYGDYNVRLIVTDSGGCKDTITKLVSIKYNHFASAGRDTLLCLNKEYVTVFLRGNGGVSYDWSPKFGLSNPSSKNTYATVATNTQYILSVTDSFGCKDKDTVEVKLHPKTMILNAPKDTAVCLGDSLQLQASGALTYEWTPASLVDNPRISNPKILGLSSPILLYVKGVDANGCEGFDTLRIGVHPSLNLLVSPKNSFACVGDSVMFTASGAKSYQWFPPKGLNADSIANPKHFVSGPKTYYVSAISNDGCRAKDSIMINVYPSPIVDAYSFANQNIVRCKGAEISLNVTGASRYSWSPAEYCSNPNGATTLVYPPINTLFTVTGTNDNGCSATDTITVIYDGSEKVFVPNTFSPNNDQVNDRIGVIDECNIQFLSMDIFNRWGQNVFSGYNLSDKWDGNFNNKPCEIGTYFYLIKARKLNGEPINFKGDITLIR